MTARNSYTNTWHIAACRAYWFAPPPPFFSLSLWCKTTKMCSSCSQSPDHSLCQHNHHGASAGACQDIPLIPLREIKLTYSDSCYVANTLCACQNTEANLMRPVAEHVLPPLTFYMAPAVARMSILQDYGWNPMCTEGCRHYAEGLSKSYLLLLHVLLF